MKNSSTELVKSNIQYYENKIASNNKAISLPKELGQPDTHLLELDNEFCKKEIQRIKSKLVRYNAAPEAVVLTTETLEKRLRYMRMATSIKIAVKDMAKQKEMFIVGERSEADQLKKGARTFIKNRCLDIASCIRSDYNNYFEENWGTIVNVVLGGEVFGCGDNALMVFVNTERVLQENPMQLSEMFDMERNFIDAFEGNEKLENLITEEYKEYKFFGSFINLYEALPVIVYTTSIIKNNNEKGGE